MCGIAGFLQLNGKTVAVDELLEMGRSLKHRGPDDSGYYLRDSRDGDCTNGLTCGDVGMAHQRLSILDLSSSGHQPMFSNDGKVVVIYNGEIYNHWALRDELRSRGYSFQGSCDGEVIPHAFSEWGIECVTKFNGMFAIAIWDERCQTLYLVRDRLGIKPLYYYHEEGDFAFASELKALLKYPHMRKELDTASLFTYLSLQYVPAPRAIFRYTHKLRPGHYLKISRSSGVEDCSYWDVVERFRALRMPREAAGDEEVVEELDKLIDSATRYRADADVPLGVLLSGGIDSSLVATALQRVSSDQVKTFTIGFENFEFDEAPFAHQIARYLGTDHRELYVTTRMALDTIPRLPVIYDEPFADSSAIPTHLVCKLAREHVEVALSGDGGDELFGGYRRYEWMRHLASYHLLPRCLRKAISWTLRSTPASVIGWAHQLARPFLPQSGRIIDLKNKKERLSELIGCDDYASIYPMLVSLWPQRTLIELLGLEFSPTDTISVTELCTELAEEDIEILTMLVDLKTYLVDDILTKVDRASMAVSLEDRVPLLDHRIVENTFSLRSEQRHGKQLLRSVLAKHLPPDLYNHPKHGFSVPLAEWLRSDLRYLVRDYLNPQRLDREGLFDWHVVNQVEKEHMSGRRDHAHRLWSLVCFEMWYEEYGS